MTTAPSSRLQSSIGVRGDDRGAFLVTGHDHVGEFVAGVGGQFPQEDIVDEQEFGTSDLRL